MMDHFVVMAEMKDHIAFLEKRVMEVEKEMSDLIQSVNSGMAELADRILALEKKGDSC